MYKCKNFTIEELVPPEYLRDIDYDTLWMLFDDRLLWTADRLRNRYGVAYINDYKWGGNSIESGLRDFNTTTGAQFSSHKFGRALDPEFRDADVYSIRQDILDNPQDEDFKYITELELDISWLHFGTRNWDKEKYGILTFKPGE